MLVPSGVSCTYRQYPRYAPRRRTARARRRRKVRDALSCQLEHASTPRGPPPSRSRDGRARRPTGLGHHLQLPQVAVHPSATWRVSAVRDLRRACSVFRSSVASRCVNHEPAARATSRARPTTAIKPAAAGRRRAHFASRGNHPIGRATIGRWAPKRRRSSARVGCGGVSLRRMLVQALQTDGFQVDRDAGLQAPRRHGVIVHDLRTRSMTPSPGTADGLSVSGRGSRPGSKHQCPGQLACSGRSPVPGPCSSACPGYAR